MLDLCWVVPSDFDPCHGGIALCPQSRLLCYSFVHAIAWRTWLEMNKRIFNDSIIDLETYSYTLWNVGYLCSKTVKDASSLRQMIL